MLTTSLAAPPVAERAPTLDGAGGLRAQHVPGRAGHHDRQRGPARDRAWASTWAPAASNGSSTPTLSRWPACSSPSGALADRFGRRRVFRCGLLVFGAGVPGVRAAPSLGVLVAARAVQGIGASMLSPVALAIVVNAMPDPRERARAIGVWASVFGLSMAAGPVTGGALIAAFGWRSVFWTNAPVVVAALVLVARVRAGVPRAERARRLDLPGQVLLTAVRLRLASGSSSKARGSAGRRPSPRPATWSLTAAAVGLRAGELRRGEPLMDLGAVPAAGVRHGGARRGGRVRRSEPSSLLLDTLYLQRTPGGRRSRRAPRRCRWRSARPCARRGRAAWSAASGLDAAPRPLVHRRLRPVSGRLSSTTTGSRRVDL